MDDESADPDFAEPWVLPESIYLPKDVAFKTIREMHAWVKHQPQSIQSDLQLGEPSNFEFLKKPYEEALKEFQEEMGEGDEFAAWVQKQISVFEDLVEKLTQGFSYAENSQIHWFLNNLGLNHQERTGFLCGAFNVEPFADGAPFGTLKNPQHRQSFITGYVEAHALNLSKKSGLVPQRAQIDACLGEAHTTTMNLQSALNNLKKESAEFQTKRDSEIVTINNKVEELIIERSARFRKIRDEHNAEFRRIEEAFEKYVSLKDSIVFWEKRAVHNFQISGAALLAFVILSAVAIWLTINEGPKLLEALIVIVSTNDALAKNPLSYLGFATLPALLLLWVLKFPARLFKEHLHIANDARHRHTLISTYLSLLRDKSAPISGEERHFALRQIFSNPSAQSGDDPIPVLSKMFEESKFK